MQLKPGNNIKYGIPYQGSKTKLIEKIARFFPNADHFYDLFGGGFSVSHYMIKHRSKSYKHFYYNELRSNICELIKDAINGKYNYDVFKPEWISRERFEAEKENCAYIKLIWSFGNNGESYLYGKEIENQKRSMHQAVIFNEFDDWFVDTFKFNSWPKLTITGKRIYLRKSISNLNRHDLQQLERLQQLQQLERLQQLQQLQQLQRLELTNLDYRKVEIKPNSVIYCDIPYQRTTDYGNIFNHKEFFEWANNKQNPVFISEYNIVDDRFYLLKTFKHRTSFSASDNNEVCEKLYGNKIAYDIIQKAIKSSTKSIGKE